MKERKEKPSEVNQAACWKWKKKEEGVTIEAKLGIKNLSGQEIAHTHEERGEKVILRLKWPMTSF